MSSLCYWGASIFFFWGGGGGVAPAPPQKMLCPPIPSRHAPAIENIWRIIKRKIRQRRPPTLQQLKIYIRQEWDQILTPRLRMLINSIPRHLQSVLKRRGDASPDSTGTSVQPRPNIETSVSLPETSKKHRPDVCELLGPPW